MEFLQQDMHFYKPITTHFSGFTESADAIIPDSFPDIEENAFSCASITIKDELPQTDRVLISGMIEVVVLYRNSQEEGLRRLDVPISFAHVEDMIGISPETKCYLQCSVTQTDVRIINSRKISVSCSVAVVSDYYLPTGCRITRDIADETDSVELRRCTAEMPLISAVSVRRFVILDDLELMQGDMPTPLHIDVQLADSECSVAGGRLILNGSVRLHIWDLQGGNLKLRTQTIPFHQILDAENLEDGVQTTVRLACHSVISHYANENMLSVNLNTEALFRQEKSEAVEWIDDAYHLNCASKTEFQNVTISTCQSMGAMSSECVMPITTARPIREVLSAEAVCSSVLPPVEKELKLILNCSILYRDTEDRICQMYRPITCAFPCHFLQEKMNSCSMNFQLTATPQENNLQLKIGMSGQLEQVSIVQIPNLTKLQLSETDRAERALRLIFVHEGKSIWDLAKENRTTSDAVRIANHIDDHAEMITDTVVLVP